MRSPLILFVLSGCAIAIPVVQPTPSAPLPALELEVCRLDGEVQHRKLWAAIDDFSFAPWHQVISSVVVKHPRGLLVIDPAFGEEVAADLRQTPLWFRLLMG
ncbi:MAG: hypothetical protein H6Q89_5633, partial [Myxococcaceae bacterium]|nr:hypothetical protein [Myxococcaceae bacterium]